jgi:hypothetical protein
MATNAARSQITQPAEDLSFQRFMRYVATS